MAELTGHPQSLVAGRYAFESEIGRGGMGTVYRARDLQQNRLVAVKVFRPDLAAALGPARFLREITIAAHLGHPHIVPLYDSGQIEGTLYYVMPYIEGEALRTQLRRRVQLPVAEALAITREVADALAYAHEHGVVHRDIKPENILLQAGHALVADFGIARAIDAAGGEALTETGIVLGTPTYMSPEQASGDAVDGRSDLYSLGCVLYEMLAGEPPFTGRNAQAIIARHRSDSPRSLRTVRAGVPPGVEQALQRVLSKVPADRFDTPGDFVRALDSPGSVSAKGFAWKRAASVGVLGLVVAGAMMVGPLRRPPTEPHPVGVVILPFDDAASTSGPRDVASLHVAFQDALGWLPIVRPIDGTALVSEPGGWRSTSLPRLLRGARRLGGAYVVAGTVRGGPAAQHVSVELYTTDGEQLLRSDEPVTGNQVDESIGRLALTSVSALAHREDLTIGPGGSLLSATTSASALGHLLQGQKHFWSGDLERAAAEFQAAIKADSGCGLAYMRLSLVQAWQFDYGAAVGSVDAGLGLRERMAPRWVNLLEAQRHLMLGSGREAIDGFQNAVLDHRDDIDAWFGLGESLFHYGAWNGQSPQDSRPALERVAQLDSTFAPIYDHLVDLALLEGDSIRAARSLDRMPADPSKEVRRVAMVLRFGPYSARHGALKQLRAIDRQALSQLVPIYLHDGLDPALADTIAMSLLGPDRTPDDRRRGAAFRLVSLAAQHRWPEAVASWKSAAGAPVFDSWIIQAQLAGFPAADLAKPMYAWADSLLRAGRLPDFTLPFWEDAQQGFHAIVHRAALAGDSAGVADLLRRIDTAPPNADPSDPTKDTFRAALEARLALLAADTTKAIERLRLSVSRVQEPWTWYYPLTAMAPERLLLSALLDARGAADESARWRRSFTHSWSVGDVLFATTLQARATAPADALAR